MIAAAHICVYGYVKSSRWTTPAPRNQGQHGTALSPTDTIPSLAPSAPSSSSIPLRTLVPSGPESDDQLSLLDSADEKHHGARRASGSAGSDFSLFSEAGDLGDQLAAEHDLDEDDPLQFESDGDAAGRHKYGNGRSNKGRVKYVEEHKARAKGHSAKKSITKEHIRIPDPPRRRISVPEIVLAFIMTGRRQSSLQNGLVGKPLL